MFAWVTVRRFRGRRRLSVFALALTAAFLAIPALAYAAGGTTIGADLVGPAGYCQNFAAAGAAAAGQVQISTSPAAAPGFHSVRVDIKVRPGQLPAGAYQVWLVNLYRDDAGHVIGCAASPFATPMTVTSRSHGPTDFQGSVARYTGEYELQVYVGPIWGPGYGTAPAVVDVP